MAQEMESVYFHLCHQPLFSPLPRHFDSITDSKLCGEYYIIQFVRHISFHTCSFRGMDYSPIELYYV
jgi:hypothetical protein